MTLAGHEGWTPRALDRKILIRKAVWRGMLLRAQDGWCPICGLRLRAGGRLNMDHVIPRGRGGPDKLGNVLLAHVACNDAKGGRMPTGCELIALLAANCRMGVQPQAW